MVRSLLVLLALALLAACSTQAARGQEGAARAVDPALQSAPWPARWIAHPTAEGTAAGVYHFRKTIELAEAPERFVVHVSADNRYRLFVNGTSVGTGPARGDLANWRFETYDLAPHLRAGPNVVAAVVWNFGAARPAAQVSLETAFLVQGGGTAEAALNTGVDDGAPWRVLRDTSYALLTPDRASMGWPYLVVGPGEAVDAARYPWGWKTLAYDDAGWAAARPLREAVPRGGHHRDIYTAWRLVPRGIPPMEETPQRLARVVRAEGVRADDAFLRGEGDLVVPPRTRATVLVDNDVLTTAYLHLRASGGAGAELTVRYAEALVDSAGRKGHRDETEGKRLVGYHDRFRFDGGEGRAFETLWWRTYRYVQLEVATADEPLVLHDVWGVFTAYPFEERAAFRASDDGLDDVWDVGWRTARLCAGETYFDCPYYEQLQYVGDTRIQALISYYVAGDDRLARQAIDAFHASRVPDGLTASRYPDALQQFIPPYSLLWVSMVYDYWMHRPDGAFVARHLNGIRGVLDWYAARVREDGLVGRAAGWNFVDWSFGAERNMSGTPPGGDDGGSSVIALQYAYALGHGAALAEAFGRADEAADYRARAAAVREAVRRMAWDEGRALFADTPARASFSEHANILAVLTGAVPPDEAPALLERMLAAGDLTPATYYFRFYLDRAMREAGLGGTYVGRLEPWAAMLRLGLTTFAEQPEPTRSDCHAWSAAPLYDLLATVLGVEPAAPGFGAVRIAPALGGLRWAEGTVPHPAGDITVRLDRDGERLTATVTLPDGVDGVFAWNGASRPLRPGRQTLTM